MFGTAMIRADFEHCDVALFLGKNPWQSHSIPHARVTLKEIAKDPARTLIVVDPRRTETAEMADIHLPLRPGTDAYLLAAILGHPRRGGARGTARSSTRTPRASRRSRQALRAVPVADFCARAGLDEALVRRTARVLGSARALASFEDLGVQMNRDSTLVSYLHRLLVALTGSFGREGTAYVPTSIVAIASGASKRRSPVVGAPIVGGLVPCNVIADEILTDHPTRYRAMIVEAANPAHSVADSKRFRDALRALDTLVVIDVAMTETARLAHYVLPAATQFEKAEATFFNFEFPRNAFHLRPRLLSPPEGALPEAEIHARLCLALGAVTEDDLAPLRAAAAEGKAAYAQAVVERLLGDPRLAAQAPVLLYRTMDLPPELREGAVLLALALRAAMQSPASLARAGFGGSPIEAAQALFDAILASPSGVVFAVDGWDEVMGRIGTARREDPPGAPRPPRRARQAPGRGPRRPRSCLPLRPLRRRTPVLHRQHHHPRPGLAEVGRRGRPADVPGRRGVARGRHGGPRPALHPARLGAGAGGGVGHAAARPRVAPERPRALHRVGRRGRRRRAERAHRQRGPRPVRRDPVAQARAGPGRTGLRLATHGPGRPCPDGSPAPFPPGQLRGVDDP